MLDSQFLAFCLLAALLTMSPGVDMILVLRNLLAHGKTAALQTTAGICCGLFVHAILSALGVSAIIMVSATAFTVLKIAGACVLVFLGLQSLWQATCRRRSHAPGTPSVPVFWQGFLTNVLNPKVAVFYLAVLPQFVAPAEPVLTKSLLLASVHSGMGVLWLGGLSFAAARARRFLARERVRRGLEAASGVVLIGLGARLAVAK